MAGHPRPPRAPLARRPAELPGPAAHHQAAGASSAPRFAHAYKPGTVYAEDLAFADEYAWPGCPLAGYHAKLSRTCI
jgi:hypothetical protein